MSAYELTFCVTKIKRYYIIVYKLYHADIIVRQLLEQRHIKKPDIPGDTPVVFLKSYKLQQGIIKISNTFQIASVLPKICILVLQNISGIMEPFLQAVNNVIQVFIKFFDVFTKHKQYKACIRVTYAPPVSARGVKSVDTFDRVYPLFIYVGNTLTYYGK